eukprot:236577_1
MATTASTTLPTPSPISISTSTDTESSDTFLILSIVACVTLCFILVVCSLIYVKIHKHNSEMMSLSLTNHRKRTNTNNNDDNNTNQNIINQKEDAETINIQIKSIKPQLSQTPSLPPLPKQMTITQTPPGLADHRSQTNRESEGNNPNGDIVDIPFMEPIHESVSLTDEKPIQLNTIPNNYSNSDDIYNKAVVVTTINGMNQDKNTLMIWLNTLGLSKYYNNFIINGYENLQYIKEIKETKELNDIKITIFVDQIKIMNAIKELQTININMKQDDEKVIELNAMEKQMTLSDDMYEIKPDINAIHTTTKGEILIENDTKTFVIDEKDHSLSEDIYNNIKMHMDTDDGIIEKQMTLSDDMYDIKPDGNTANINGETLIENDDAKIFLMIDEYDNSLSDDMYNNIQMHMNTNTNDGTQEIQYTNDKQIFVNNNNEHNIQFDTTEMKHYNDNIDNENMQFIDHDKSVSPNVNDKIYVVPN